MVFVWFCIRVILALQGELESVLSSSIFRESLYRIDVNSLNVWCNITVKLSGLAVFCVGCFRTMNSIFFFFVIDSCLFNLLLGRT